MERGGGQQRNDEQRAEDSQASHKETNEQKRDGEEPHAAKIQAWRLSK